MSGLLLRLWVLSGISGMTPSSILVQGPLPVQGIARGAPGGVLFWSSGRRIKDRRGLCTWV